MNNNVFADFNRLAEVVLAYRSSKPLLVALHYDLFTWLDRGYDTAERLSRKLRLDRRALGILLNAISALGFLKKRGDQYLLTPLTRKLLVADSPHYKGNNLKYQEQTWAAWSDLSHVVKTGKPRLSLLDWIYKDAFTEDYIKAMGDIAKEPAEDLAGKLDWRGVSRMLDVGCGPGTYSAACVKHNPKMEAVLFDLGKTLAVTKNLLRNDPYRKRFKFQTGDYLKDSFGDDDFDLIIISNVTHNENPASNRKLVRKAFQALRPGGRLVIHDFVLDPERNAPKFPALLALHLLVFTGSGSAYTVKDYSDWMRGARFKNIRCLPIANGSINPSVAILGHNN